MSKPTDQFAGFIDGMTYPLRRIIYKKTDLSDFSRLEENDYQKIERPTLSDELLKTITEVFNLKKNPINRFSVNELLEPLTTVPLTQYHPTLKTLKKKFQDETKAIQNKEEIKKLNALLEEAIKESQRFLEIQIEKAIYDKNLQKNQKRAMQQLREKNPSQAKSFITVTGKTVTIDGDAYRLNLPNRLLSSSYYRGSLNRLQGDLMSIAQHIKTTGSQGIEFNALSSDIEHANFLARQSYEAARRVGFFEDAIILKVNGKVVQADTLFKEHIAIKDAIDNEAKINRKRKLEPFGLDTEEPVVKKPAKKPKEEDEEENKKQEQPAPSYGA